MKKSLLSHPLLVCGVLWVILLAVVLLTRPLITTIETRAMTVAWEMHVRHNYLVPTLNFAPYTQKPPLLAWLINLGWALVGVQRWVATLIIGAFVLLGSVLTFKLAKILWPEHATLVRNATFMCFGAAIAQVYGTIIFYDFILVVWVLLAQLALLHAARDDRWHNWLVWGIAIGLGALTKGPVILLHVLPTALLAPLWLDRSNVPNFRWRVWYGKIVLGVILGAAIGFAWAIPAALSGGADYAKWILLQQTTHRVVHAFNHEHGWWFYLPVLPGLLLPWLILPPVCQRLSLVPTLAKSDQTIAFLLCWIIPVFLLFSAISGKQLQYILPLWPALALLAARLLTGHANGETLWRKKDVLIGFAVFEIFGLVWLVFACLPARWLSRVPDDLLTLLTTHNMLLTVYGVAISLLSYLAQRRRDVLIPAMSLAMWATVVAVHLAAIDVFPRFSSEPVSAALLQHPNRPIAFVGARYQGDINFTARVTGPVTILPPDRPERIAAFFAAHPDGLVVRQVRDPADLQPDHVLFVTPARTSRFYGLVERQP